jgi:hypothetical protein
MEAYEGVALREFRDINLYLLTVGLLPYYLFIDSSF